MSSVKSDAAFGGAVVKVSFPKAGSVPGSVVLLVLALVNFGCQSPVGQT